MTKNAEIKQDHVDTSYSPNEEHLSPDDIRLWDYEFWIAFFDLINLLLEVEINEEDI